MNAQQTSPGRLRRLFLGFLIGALAVAGFTVYNSVHGGTFDSGANLGKIDQANRTVGDPRTTPYPEGAARNDNRKPRQVAFIVRQVGTTYRINAVTTIDSDRKSATAQRVKVWKRNATNVRPGAVLLLAAGIVTNDQTLPGAGPIECAIVIDGLIYRAHFKRNPYNLGEMTCQASAVVP